MFFWVIAAGTALSINYRIEYGLIKTPLISSSSNFNLGRVKLYLGD